VSCRSVSASWYIGLELTVRLDAVRIWKAQMPFACIKLEEMRLSQVNLENG
jgi:hypothetical protein